MKVFGYIEVDDEGYDNEIEVPAKYYICEECQGHGKHSHAIDGNGITSDEWNGPDWDDESRESYMRGDYDQTCEVCEGSGKVIDVDWDKLSDDERKKCKEHKRSIAECRAIEAAERRMGA